MKKLLLLSATITLFSLRASAEPVKYSDYLTVSAGQFDSFSGDNESTVFNVEYKFEPILWDVLRPVVGGFVNSDKAAYGYAGIVLDYMLGDHFYITPGIDAGLYRHGDSKDLGGTLEFHSSIELGYEFDNRSRLGINLGHISNAGIYDDNPGSELLMLSYSIPMGN